MNSAVIEVTGLRKVYGDTVAVDGLDLSIAPQCIFGLVGPNGAGKTTAIECIEGVRVPDAGTVRVLGLEPARARARLYQQVGVQLQENSLPHRQQVIEAFRVFASLYPNPEPVDGLLAECGLQGRERTHFRRLSGGQKRRVLLGLALIGRPRLVILDEPTSGLDPQAKHNVWSVLKKRRDHGTTILLTTHDMDEAQEQCDLLCIVDHGRILAQGKPKELLSQHRVEYRVSLARDRLPPQPEALLATIKALPLTSHVETLEREWLFYGSGVEFLPAVTQTLVAHGLTQGDMETRRARLEDLFLLLTGRDYREG